MLPTELYYRLKRYLPRTLRRALRRVHAHCVLGNTRHKWPIDETAGRTPEGWPGWPHGKQFALVLTHDVESQRGLDRVRQLAELEMAHGVRSSFNFVPEGEYADSPDLRAWLEENGFEVGVHDLRHDGKLFRSRNAFRENARRIREHAQKWKTAGFRAGFMMNELEWFHDLEARYDASTFDTDPFEPQPEGVGTIFPFWVPQRRDDADADRGYAELPYTLPQDSTLFLLLGETNPEIWLRKLDWIAARGGMALVIVHPDYLRFEGEPATRWTYPAAHYEKLLRYIREKHAENAWFAQPREVAEFVKTNRKTFVRSIAPSPDRKVWIDLDNTPHVPFFQPIMHELRSRGYEVVLTARDAFQVCELADAAGLAYRKIGRHHGRNRLLKACGLVCRSLQLLPFVLREGPSLALSHGSRSQLLLCNLLRIPTVMINDYEHAQTPPFMRPRWEIVPEVLCSEALHCKERAKIRTYRGIKEDVYAPEFTPDRAILDQLHLNGDVIVTVRPPATEAHYHNPESEIFFARFMDRVTHADGVRVVLLPRNKHQETELRQRSPEWFRDSRVAVPRGAVHGLNLLWHSDLVVSGGGTMNREAAALNVPVYSIFRGKMGTVDRTLQRDGRLVLIESLDDVERRIEFKRREKIRPLEGQSRATLHDIVDHVEEIVRLETTGAVS